MTSLYVRVSQPRFCWHSELADSCCEGCPACTFSMFSSIPACYPLDTSSIPLPPCVITKNITEWGQMSPGWGWGDKVPPGWEPLLFTSDQRFQISVQRPTTFSSVSSWAFFFTVSDNYIMSVPLVNQPHPLLPPWNLTSTTETQTHLHLNDLFLPSNTEEEEDHLFVH